MAAHDAERALVVALIGVLLVSSAIWSVDWYRGYGDLSRCPERGPNFRATTVDKGAWAEPDTCLYRDLATGETVYPDASIAGAPRKPVSFGLVLASVATMALAAVGAYVWRRDSARRALEPREPSS